MYKHTLVLLGTFKIPDSGFVVSLFVSLQQYYHQKPASETSFTNYLDCSVTISAMLLIGNRAVSRLKT